MIHAGVRSKFQIRFDIASIRYHCILNVRAGLDPRVAGFKCRLQNGIAISDNGHIKIDTAGISAIIKIHFMDGPADAGIKHCLIDGLEFLAGAAGWTVSCAGSINMHRCHDMTV